VTAKDHAHAFFFGLRDVVRPNPWNGGGNIKEALAHPERPLIPLCSWNVSMNMKPSTSVAPQGFHSSGPPSFRGWQKSQTDSISKTSTVIA